MATKWFADYFSKWFSEWWFPPLEITDVPRQRIDHGGVVEATIGSISVSTGEAALAFSAALDVPPVSFILGEGKSLAFGVLGAEGRLSVTSGTGNVTVNEALDNLAVYRIDGDLQGTNGDESFRGTLARGTLTATNANGGL
jgi:hypothetical protein